MTKNNSCDLGPACWNLHGLSKCFKCWQKLNCLNFITETVSNPSYFDRSAEGLIHYSHIWLIKKKILNQASICSSLYGNNLIDADKKISKFRRKIPSVAINVLFFLACFSVFTKPVYGYERHGNPPRVVASDVNTMTASPGETVTLPCTVSGNPLPLTVWWKDDSQISRDWKRFKQQRMSLRIRNIEESDSGLYYCEAVNGYGAKQVEIHLKVLGGTKTASHHSRKREEVKPIFSQPIKMRRHNIVKPLGSTASFKCKARGRPRPKIQWFKDGNLTKQKTISSLGKPRWTLTLRDITVEDSGRYTCRVWNQAGEITFDYTLRVVGHDRRELPVLLRPHPINTTVREGEKASIQCRVRSVMAPTVKWIKRLDKNSLQSFSGNWPNNSLKIDDKVYLILPAQEMMRLPDGSYLNKLIINHAKPEDSGMYICLGANTMGYNFKYSYLTVNPAGGRNNILHIQREKKDKSFSLPLIIGIPAGAGLLIVCSITLYCLCKREEMGKISGKVNRTSQTMPTFRDSRSSYDGVVVPMPSTSCNNGGSALNEHEYCDVPCVSSSSRKYDTAPHSNASVVESHLPNFDDKLYSDISESELTPTYMQSPPPPPPSQYSRSSSAETVSKPRSHHSCHRSGRHYHNHHHHRYRSPPSSLSSRSCYSRKIIF